MEDQAYQEYQEKASDLENKTPEVITSFVQNVLFLLSTYGWHFVFFGVLSVLAYGPLEKKYRKWQKDKQDQQRMTEYAQNPERIISLQEAMLQSRLRLQEQHDQLTAEHLEKVKKAEDARRQEKIEKYKCFKAGTSYSAEAKSMSPANTPEQVSRPSKKDGKNLRGQDYNPLMGSSSGACYRPSRRGGSSGG